MNEVTSNRKYVGGRTPFRRVVQVIKFDNEVKGLFHQGQTDYVSSACSRQVCRDCREFRDYKIQTLAQIHTSRATVFQMGFKAHTISWVTPERFRAIETNTDSRTGIRKEIVVILWGPGRNFKDCKTAEIEFQDIYQTTKNQSRIQNRNVLGGAFKHKGLRRNFKFVKV